MLLHIQKLHIFPVIALVMWTFGIMVLMARRRFSAIRKGEIPPGYFKDFQQRSSFLIPDKVQTASRNFSNLFEIPVLFYALISFLILADKADGITLFFAWMFVLTRVVHSIIHVTRNKLMYRMRVYFIGSFILFLLWVRLFLQLLGD